MEWGTVGSPRCEFGTSAARLTRGAELSFSSREIGSQGRFKSGPPEGPTQYRGANLNTARGKGRPGSGRIGAREIATNAP
jgi:hypothetical protein